MSQIEALGREFLEWSGIQGIDWSQYDEAGALLRDPRYTYKDELTSRFGAFVRVIGSLTVADEYRTIRASEGRVAITGVYEKLNNHATIVWDAIKRGDVMLAVDQGLEMPTDLLRNSLATIAAYAADGAFLHFDGIFDDAMHLGEIDLSELREHADQMARIMEAFVLIDEQDGWSMLKRGGPSSGLGIEAGVMILLLVSIIGVCYLVWALFIASKTQDKVVAWCDKLIEQGGSEQAQFCIESMQKMTNDSIAQLFEPLNKVGMIVGVGLVLYVGVMLLPHVTEALRKTKAASA